MHRNRTGVSFLLLFICQGLPRPLRLLVNVARLRACCCNLVWRLAIPPRPELPTRPERPERDGPRINNEIRARTVRLVGADGEMVGVVGLFEALRLADEADLDLVEVSPNAEPPVCKILDAGKYKYELQKKANEARKKQKVIEIKEIKLRPNIGDHDYQIKMKQVKEFLGEGDKVKFTLRFRGREMAHQDIGYQLMQRVQADIAELAKVEQHPKLEGKQMVMMVSAK